MPLLPLAEAARAGDAAAAEAAIARLSGGPLAVLTRALRGWTALARGSDPLAALDAPGNDPIARRFAAENRALLLIATGKSAEGTAALAALGPAGIPVDTRFAAVQLLLGRGERTAAQTLAAGDPALAATLAGPGAKPTLGFGVAQLFTRVAAELADGTPPPLSVALTRAALVADPTSDRARLLLADALIKGGSGDRALLVLDQVAPASPWAGAAAMQRISALDTEGDAAGALAAAQARAARSGATAADLQVYADLLVTRGRPADAAPIYRRLLDSGSGTRWAAWLQYGGALDQAGRWRQARAALEQAVKLAPAEPLALNYLGYARIEHGEAMAASAKMLERANALAPNDASIADSLGWAYHLTGDTPRGLPLLERAAAREPTNAEISEHLGDAYWTVGRRYEARYAWRAAAVTANADDAARLAAKITNGLGKDRRR